jgi:uncharacterized protein YndB with AHSA1/START domain
MTDELASFDDAWTLRYERVYPHPIARVWAAVTSAEQLDVWLAPACGVLVEPWLGGRCEFCFGGPNPDMAEHDPVDRSTWSHSGSITEFEPPNLVHYQLGASALRFELEEVDGATRLCFVHSFTPGPESPWRAGFMAGFHQMLRQLGTMLDGAWGREQAQPYIDAVQRGEGVHALMHERMTSEQRAIDEDLVDRYRIYARERLGVDA